MTEEIHDWPVVRTVGSDEEAKLIVGFLESREIPAKVESLKFHQEPVNFGAMGEVRVHVHPDHAVEAGELLASQDRGADALEEGEVIEGSERLEGDETVGER
jgi:hypothetical protein